jgi:flagellin
MEEIMLISSNQTYKSFVSSYNMQNNKLTTSMSRLATGSKMVVPGDAPADLGISERFRAQIRNSEAATSVIQNAVNMFQTTDAFLQEVQNILNRMSELAVGAADGSKNQADRKNLDLEFQQLKQEISRISEDGKYNGLQINGNTAVSFYDSMTHKIKYTQGDGSDMRELDINFRDGGTASNGVAYAFESSAANGYVGDFLFTEDGKSLLYIAQDSVGALSARQTLMKLDIESNQISTVQLTSAGGMSANTQARIVMDEKGRVWVSNPAITTSSALKSFSVNLLNAEAMTLDAGGAGITNQWAGSVTLASTFSNFAAYDDYLYFIERSSGTGPLRYVKQSIFDSSDRSILINDLSGSSYDLEKGENYAISADGQFLAFEDEDNSTTGMMVVINTNTGEKATFQAGTRTNSITGLDFDANNRLYWIDSGNTSDENAVKRAKISTGDKPYIEDVEIIQKGNAGHLGSYNSAQAAKNMGLSVGGGSPASSYEFHIGPDRNTSVEFVSADVRLTKLGLSRLDVLSIDDAQVAITKIADAIDNVSNQRAVLGAQVSRLNFMQTVNASYTNNMSEAESRIRDVDIALETAKLTNAQIAQQTAISILGQNNSMKQNVLRLLQ